MPETNGQLSDHGAQPLVERVGRVSGFRTLRAAVEKSQAAAQHRAPEINRPDSGRAARATAGLPPPAPRVHVTGLRGSSAVFLAEALRARLERPAVLVCPDQEAAEDAFSDLRTISGARALLFPERDIFPQRYQARENPAVRGDRNEALLKILSGQADVVVTSLLGFLEKAIPVEMLQSSRIALHAGDTIDLERLRGALVKSGYEAVTVVEEAGQFAVRGSIVDVFDPSWEHPARLELLDDEVASLRTFDLDTQCSIASVDAVTILPAASVPIDEDSTDRLRSFLSDAGFESDTVDRIAQEVSLHRRSYLWRRYAPALGMTGSLLDYFQAVPLVLFTHADAHGRAYQKLIDEIDNAARRPDDEFPMLGLDDYLHQPDYFERHGAASVHVWDLSGVGDEAEKHRVFAPITSEEPVVKFTTTSHPSVSGNLNSLIGYIRKLHKSGVDVYVYSETQTQRERLADMLEEDEHIVHLPVGWIASGFIWEQAGIAVLTDHQIFNRVLPRPRKTQKKRRVQGIRHDHLQVGDFVVHVEHGIARFVGLEKVGAGEDQTECLILRFLGNDRVFVPLDQMHLVEKYVGKEGAIPQMDRLGGTRWHKSKEKAKKCIEDIARDLLGIYAAREIAKGHACGPDTQWQKELEAAFPHEETPHQLRATEEIKSDMEAERPMDRLVCGDVGYGKTEVAIRAAFKAIAEGKQVAVLAPTTLLAFQHFNTFQERLAGFPVNTRMLSRFVTKAEQKKIIEGLRDGSVDVVIGTHRLLSKDVGFKDLGILVVDEEHRFGVKHKERLKRLTKSVDVLALTATPIPRTLYMSLSGLRQLSVIDTPPRNRHPVKTAVLAFDEEVIQRAVAEEVSRGGQVFFVHNRVQSINSMQAFLERLLPGVRIGVAHGQMKESDLEKIVLAFTKREFDVLVSTMIIESGLDFPNVNTIVVNRADRFGLAQLYQLRGRVGRREQQAYAYFLVPRQLALTEDAGRRLQAMEEFEELGSGYRLAMRDLEIRGAGNVLGVEQHGHIAAIGFELYCRMLKDAVEKLRGEKKPEIPDCRIESFYRYHIPDTYVEDADERMMLYKRLARTTNSNDLDNIEAELTDRFGALPKPARNLLDLTAVKLQAALLGIAVVRFKPDRPARSRRARSAELEKALGGVPRILRASGGGPTAENPGEPGAGRRSAGGHVDRRPDSGEGVAGKGLAAGTGTPVNGEDSGVVEFEFSPHKALTAQQCGMLVETFGRRLLFKSGKAFGVMLEAQKSTRLLTDAKNLLQVAVHSTRLNVYPAGN